MAVRSFLLVQLHLLTSPIFAEVKPYITTAAEYDTECKTCPRSLCRNQLYYDYDEIFNATCWTRGTKIMGDRLWLRSEAGCYVTQYDVLECAGDCKIQSSKRMIRETNHQPTPTQIQQTSPTAAPTPRIKTSPSPPQPSNTKQNAASARNSTATPPPTSPKTPT